MIDRSKNDAYPEKLPIVPLDRPPDCAIRVPGSKSITNRALAIAALAGPQESVAESVLTGALRSEDTEVMVDCLRKLGIDIQCDWDKAQITIPAGDGKFPATYATLNVENSGTTMRFLTAMVSPSHGTYRLDGIPRMRERPIKDLLDALQQLGVRAAGLSPNGCPPVVVETYGLPGGTVRIKGNVSSQFLSGLLMAAPLAMDDVTIEVEGVLVSWPYVAMTMDIMSDFGATVEWDDNYQFFVPGRQSYRARNYVIEPDASAASYFAGAAAITGGCVRLKDVNDIQSVQGDVRFLHVLTKMGCTLHYGDDHIEVRGGNLTGIDIDMNHISDTVMTLAVVACFAEGPTTIRNVAHIKHKETDRLTALANELQRIGARVDVFTDGLTIHPGTLHGAEIETYNDHRMAMSFALAGLRVSGIVIKDPGCAAKTYPNFFVDLEKLR